MRERTDPSVRPEPPSSPRTLAEVAERLGVALAGRGTAPAAGAPADASEDGPPAGAAAPVARAVLDSRAVRPGDLYAALPGATTHGARFAAAAAAAGAVAVLTDADGAALLEEAAGDAPDGARPDAGPLDLPVLVVDDPRARLGPLSAWLVGDPAARLTVLGVTGTNGKTTVTSLVEGALTASGVRAGLVGTTGVRIAGEPLAGVRTTPEAPDLQDLLARMVDARVGVCAMEVSSHAAVMHRVDGVVFDVLAFTHLTRDHLDLHGDMESYFSAKASLFTPERARAAVVVVDDVWGRRLAALCRERGVPLTTVSAAGTDGPADPADSAPPADVRAVEVVTGDAGSSFVLVTAAGRTACATTLPGSFNVSNAALAHAVLLAAGLGDAAGAVALAAGPPGRMQLVAGPSGPRGIVDYAHTPDAVAAALAALRPTTPGLLVVVLGAGGDRDRGKRGAMGAAAALGADVVVVTDDNPRSEDPGAIRAAVLDGARRAPAGNARLVEVGDRAAAVSAAVSAAARVEGSTVLLAGKGHESGQEVAGTTTPFDDVAELAAALSAPAGPSSAAAPAGADGPAASSGPAPAVDR